MKRTNPRPIWHAASARLIRDSWYFLDAPLSLRDLPYEPVCNGSYSAERKALSKKTEALRLRSLSSELCSLGPVFVPLPFGFTPTLRPCRFLCPTNGESEGWTSRNGGACEE